MSDPKRATLITVGAPKSAKNNVNKTVRLTINLVESNESKYPALNYKELVIAEERKKRVENGKTKVLDPFSDHDDDDVQRRVRKLQQKYGGKSAYARKGRAKRDDFADIGAGYDESDSFIDNTHGYDEMIPPECDTLYGGFYINSGSLEFKTVENQTVHSDADPGHKRNKRPISSSSSEEESSESSTESSQDVKDPKAIANGAVDSHKTEHRKKKNKKIDKKKAKKIRRTDSSAATSGKQTSDDNGHGDGESADSRTSQSDSLASKPAPSSENAVTSDSSRDTETKLEVKLPASVVVIIEELEALVGRQQGDTANCNAKDLEAKTEQHLVRLDRELSASSASSSVRKAAWARSARCLGTTRAALLHKIKAASAHAAKPATNSTQPSSTAQSTATTTAATATKRKAEDDEALEDIDYSQLTPEEREAAIVETLRRLKVLIEERKPDMISNYNAECARVQEEKKKLQVASATGGAPHIEKRLPKRRFPWCTRSRALLVALTRLAPERASAAALLAQRALPLFPSGFVRMPTLLRQADLSKELKTTEVKRQRLGSSSQPAAAAPAPAPAPTPPAPTPPPFEPIQFPSSLTVTTTTNVRPDKAEVAVGTDDKDKYKTNSVFGSIINSFSLSKDLIVEKPEERRKEERKDEVYIPPNNIGSITITPVPNQPKDKKVPVAPVVTQEKKDCLIRVKSPAALNEMVVSAPKKEKEKPKKPEKNHVKEKSRVDSPLHVDTSYQPSKKDPSPKTKDEITQKQIESMRIAENNIPRPALVPVHHSPTFAKPDKRPPEVKKKKDVVIVSDLDPLGDIQPEPFAVDDSSSDVEVVEDSKNTDKSEPKSSDNRCDTVPSKDILYVDPKKVSSAKHKERSSVKDSKTEKRSDSLDEPTKADIDNIMRNIREMEHSQEPNLNSNTYAGVITSAKHEKSSSQPPFSQRNSIFGETRTNKDKFAERTSLNKMDGCNAITG